MLLSTGYTKEQLVDLLVPHHEFRPFANVSERNFWDAFSRELREAIVTRGEAYRDYAWPTLSAVRYLDYVRTGNRTRYAQLYFDRRFALGTLALAECLEGAGRFLDDIINGIWLICEESSWVVPAHNSINNDAPLPDVTNPGIDLFAAETGALLSWVCYLLQPVLDDVSPIICQRIRYEVQQRILTPYLTVNSFWWMGVVKSPNHHVNNWNPWCNSNCLTAFLLLETDQSRRVQAVDKCLRSLDHFLAEYHDDGGCDEGPAYWNRAGGALFDCLELLHLASRGKIDVYNEPLIRNIGRYIYRMHIAADWFVNFADCSARLASPDDLVYSYGRRIHDQQMIALGRARFPLNIEEIEFPRWFPMFRVLHTLTQYEQITAASAESPSVRDVWLDGIQVMAARQQERSCQGLFLAAKGGHNNESHNHNDVGSFIVYADGKPAIIDVGVETYTAKTFSSSRYDIWTMQSQYHNLPTVNGIGQQAGSEFRASDVHYSRTDELVEFSLNLATAYPLEAGLERWNRRISVQRGNTSVIEIVDDFTLKQPTQAIMLTFMTPCEHDLSKDGTLLLRLTGGPEIGIAYDPAILAASSERIAIHDERLRSVWGDHVYRILLTVNTSIQAAVWTCSLTDSEACLSRIKL